MILLLFFVWDPDDGQNLATSLSFGTIFFLCVCMMFVYVAHLHNLKVSSKSYSFNIDPPKDRLLFHVNANKEGWLLILHWG